MVQENCFDVSVHKVSSRIKHEMAAYKIGFYEIILAFAYHTTLLLKMQMFFQMVLTFPSGLCKLYIVHTCALKKNNARNNQRYCQARRGFSYNCFARSS